MLPHLRATIARQTAKLTNMVEADGNEDGYPALLPDIQRYAPPKDGSWCLTC